MAFNTHKKISKSWIVTVYVYLFSHSIDFSLEQNDIPKGYGVHQAFKVSQ